MPVEGSESPRVSLSCPASPSSTPTAQTTVGPAPGLAPLPRMTADRLLTSDGSALRLLSWLPAAGTPPRAVILALHGFNDHAGAFDGPGHWLAAQGIAVLAYDHRGFGGSPQRGGWPGPEALIRDARDAVCAAAARYPGRPLILLGESMGGAIALLAARGAVGTPGGAVRDHLAGLILSAPAVWARATMPWFYRAALWVSETFFPGVRLSGEGLDLFPSDNLPMLRALATDPLWIHEPSTDALAGVTDLMDLAYAAALNEDRAEGAGDGDGRTRPLALPPVLMLYGLNDVIIPAAPTRAVARSLMARAGARLAVYPEGWHMLLRDRQAATVLADIAAWVEAPAGPVSATAEAAAAAFVAGDLRSVMEEGGRPDPRHKGPEPAAAPTPAPKDEP